MAINTKGMRSITVDGVKYFWRFNQPAQIFLAEGPYSELRVDFGKFFNWIDFGESIDPDAQYFEPKILTPKYIRQAIIFAHQAGWRVGKFSLTYRNGKFAIKE